MALLDQNRGFFHVPPENALSLELTVISSRDLMWSLLSPLYLLLVLSDLPESDLDIPDDPILDFVNSQCHASEDLDQVLRAYQAYQVPCPQDSTIIPETSIDHHYTYHIAQASQATHGSLVDRGANGGLAGSEQRILSCSSRKCTFTGIDNH